MDDMKWSTPEADAEKDSAVFPRFYTKQVQHKAKSLEAGRPIFVDVDYVEIRIAGDNKNIIDKKVKQEHKDRWPRQYEAHKNGKENQMEGMPVREWGSLPASRALELNAVNVFTVEQLADLSDSNLHYVGMDARDLRTKAQAYIKSQKESGFSERMMLENQKLKDELDFLKEKMTPLCDKLETLTNEVNKLKGENNG